MSGSSTSLPFKGEMLIRRNSGTLTAVIELVADIQRFLLKSNVRRQYEAYNMLYSKQPHTYSYSVSKVTEMDIMMHVRESARPERPVPGPVFYTPTRSYCLPPKSTKRRSPASLLPTLQPSPGSLPSCSLLFALQPTFSSSQHTKPSLVPRQSILEAGRFQER